MITSLHCHVEPYRPCAVLKTSPSRDTGAGRGARPADPRRLVGEAPGWLPAVLELRSFTCCRASGSFWGHPGDAMGTVAATACTRATARFRCVGRSSSSSPASCSIATQLLCMYILYARVLPLSRNARRVVFVVWTLNFRLKLKPTVPNTCGAHMIL